MSKLKANIIANAGGQAWGAILGIALVPFYLRYLGVEAYGLVGFFVSLQAIISILDMGLSTTANRELARMSVEQETAAEVRTMVRTLEVIYLAVAVLIAICFLALSKWVSTEWVIAEKLPTETVQFAVILLGLTIATRWPVALYTGVMRGMERQVLLNVLTAGFSTLRGVGAVAVLALVSQSISAFLLWHLFASLLEVAATSVITWKILPRTSGANAFFSFDQLKAVWNFTVGVGVISIFAAVLKQIDKVFISKMLPLEELGYYTTASIAATSLSWMVSPVALALFPRFSVLYQKNDFPALSEIYHKSSQVVSFLVAPFAGMLMFFSHDVLFAWTHSTDVSAHAALALSILAFASLFNAMMQIPYMLQLASGLTWIPFWNNGIAVVVLTPLIYFLVSHYSIAGGAAAWAVFNVFYYFINPHITHRYILRGQLIKWITQDTLPFMAASVVIFGGIRYAFPLGFPWYVSVMTGFIMYLAGMYFFHRPIRSYVVEILNIKCAKGDIAGNQQRI